MVKFTPFQGVSQVEGALLLREEICTSSNGGRDARGRLGSWHRPHLHQGWSPGRCPPRQWPSDGFGSNSGKEGALCPSGPRKLGQCDVLVDLQQIAVVPDQLRPYTGYLYGFVGDQVEVRGHIELRTTFTDGITSRTENIRYLSCWCSLSLQHTVGQTYLEHVGSDSIDEAHEDETVFLGGDSDHHQTRPEGG